MNIKMIGLTIGVVLMVQYSIKASRAQVATEPAADLNNSTDWYEDMWARLHGRDLSIDGDHPQPGHYDVYGLKNAMGWNYQWDGSIKPGNA